MSGDMKAKDYKSGITPVWCAGCGNYGALSAIYRALAELQIDPANLVNVSGIGCSSRMPYFLKAFKMHTLHGRAGPVATGLQLARPDLNVLVTGGDGDGFSIGGGHMPHLGRSNVNLTYVLMDNHIYGLTKGQFSPTSRREMKAYTTPYGGIEDIKMGIFKHVSRAFEEDPLRVLRVARFSARFPQFSIDPKTFDLMYLMISRGDLAELPPERIYSEIDKALISEAPGRFFRFLNDLNAGSKLWPELNENAVGLCEQIASLSTGREERIAALFWYLDNDAMKKINNRLKLPKQLVDLALLRDHFEVWSKLDSLTATDIVAWLYHIDAFRRVDRFKKVNRFFDVVSKCLLELSPELSPEPLLQPSPKTDHIKNYQDAWLKNHELATSIKAKEFTAKYQGKALGQALRLAQIEKISSGES